MLKLVKPCIKYKKQYIEMMKEWKTTSETFVQYSIKKSNYNNFSKMLIDFKNESISINLEF